MDIKPYIEKLKNADILSPGAELKILFDHVFGEGFTDYPATIEELPEETRQKLDALIEKRVAHMPSIRICGKASFGAVTVDVANGVFAPCPETAGVADHAVIVLKEKPGPLRVLDLGTGTGCLLLEILKNIPQATGVGIDCNGKAIALAKDNAKKNGLDGRVDFRTNDWATALDEKFDLIVSNPPRVAKKDIPFLMPEMKDFDPIESIDGGKDGLDFFRRLASDFGRLAKDEGRGLFQTGPVRAKTVQRIFRAHAFPVSEIKRDYVGLPLCLLVRNRRIEPSGISRLFPFL